MGPAPMTSRPSMVTSGTRTSGRSGAKLETLNGAHPTLTTSFPNLLAQASHRHVCEDGHRQRAASDRRCRSILTRSNPPETRT